MRYVIPVIFIVVGVLHGWHVFNIEYGSIANLTGNRFLSFPSLDRIASSGIAGKFLVLSIDSAIAALGFFDFMRQRKRGRNK
jgi:hypothetical protein